MLFSVTEYAFHYLSNCNLYRFYEGHTILIGTWRIFIQYIRESCKKNPQKLYRTIKGPLRCHFANYRDLPIRFCSQIRNIFSQIKLKYDRLIKLLTCYDSGKIIDSMETPLFIIKKAFIYFLKTCTYYTKSYTYIIYTSLHMTYKNFDLIRMLKPMKPLNTRGRHSRD